MTDQQVRETIRTEPVPVAAPTPTISVCIPLYNKDGFVAETIRSVLAQTFTDFELVVLDNASTDRSAEIARSFADPRVTVVSNPATVGPIENFNLVVALSTAPLVKVLCADDLLHPTCLERQVAVMEQDPALAMVTCRQDMVDEHGRVLARDRGLRHRDLVGRGDRSAVVRRMVRHGGNPVGNVNNVVFRRAAFEAAGGFPVSGDFFALDVDMWARLLRHGDYHGIGETLTSFRISSGSHSSELGRRAIGIQHAFVAAVRQDHADVVRPRDRLFGLLRSPLTRVRHHVLFAAAGPARSARRRAATRVLRIGRSAAADRTGATAVLETEPTGHRLHYLAHLVDAGGPAGVTVLTTRDVVASADYELVSGTLAGATEVLGDAGSPAAALAAAVRFAREHEIHRLVVPEAEAYLLPALRGLLRRPWSRTELRLLLLRTTTVGGPERLRPAMLVKPALVALLRLFPQVRLMFLTDALGVVARRRGYRGLQPVKDPVVVPGPDRPQPPDWLPGATPGRTVIGVFGVVSARKNLPVLVAATATVPGAVLVVGGRLEPDVRAFVDTDAEVAALRAAGRMVVVDRLLAADELAAALAGVDAVAVLHDNDSPSGILAQACVRGTPSIVPRGGWLARVVDTTGVGLAVPLTVPGVAEGIRGVGQQRAALAAAIVRVAPRIGTSAFTDRLLGRRR